jgi:hypothetical protein
MKGGAGLLIQDIYQFEQGVIQEATFCDSRHFAAILTAVTFTRD